MGAEPTRFSTKSLRMIQRLVKLWRAEIAVQIVIDGDWLASSQPDEIAEPDLLSAR